MEGSTGSKVSCVTSIEQAVEMCKDAATDPDIRLIGLKCLYKNIAVTSRYLEDATVRKVLSYIVLESENDGKDDWRYFEIKRYAFCCLETIATDLSDEFFQYYYSYLKAQLNLNLSENNDELRIPEINKLDKYMETCDDIGKFRMLKTLSICIFESTRGVPLSIFKEFQSRDWSKELLAYTLLSNNNEWSVNEASRLVREINRLDSFMKECDSSHRIEDVLEMLIVTQKACEMDVGFIVEVLMLLHSDESLNLVSQNFCFLPNIFTRLELLRLKKKCDEQEIVYNDGKEILQLRCLLFYSDEVVDAILSKVQPGTPVTKLNEFLQTVREKSIVREMEFLLQLDATGSIEDWKRRLRLPMIEAFIGEKFPGWQYRTAAGIAHDFDETYLPPVNASNDKRCTAYREFDDAQRSKLREAVSCGNAKLHKLLYDLNRVFVKVMLQCDFAEATFQEIQRLIELLDSENKIVQLINALEILTEYEFDTSQNEINVMKIILDSTEANVQRRIHCSMIKNFFPRAYEKSVDDLIGELLTSNREGNVKLLRSRQDLMAKYNKVISAYNGSSAICTKIGINSKPIKNWDKQQITRWSVLIRLITMKKGSNASALLKSAYIQSGTDITNHFNVESLSSFLDKTLYEKIAVIKRAMEITNGIELRDVQILSVILLLNCEEGKGRLAQISTGEGKTAMIAMIAAYRALEGHQVDVVTSSKLLATSQLEQFQDFYRTLSLEAWHNFESYKAYTCDVLYGTSTEFQGDILRDEFRKTGCRYGRKFDVAIVDEVDNMLVDGNDHIVHLSSEMPAMDHLETILATIYVQMKAAAGSVIVNDGQCFFVERENVFDENGQTIEFIENRIPIAGTVRDFITNSTELHIKNLIRDCDPAKLSSDFPEIKVPVHLREFIRKTQLKKWVAKAVNAKFYYAIKEEYILHDNEIKVVDADNTGVIQQSTQLSDGLHQFLEIKHGTYVNPERLTSNFISNVSFFRRYRPNIYGLSGTLGCAETKNLLAATYDLDFVTVPTFKLKRHKELSPIILDNRDDWIREIVKSSLRKLCNGRAVLIIMEYIKETEAVQQAFVEKFRYDSRKIKMFQTDDDCSVVGKPLECGHVIVTTNIAGRGTDIKLTKLVEENGGLHVCITFLPKNSRVEEQNVGRTSRTGNRGTSQFVLCSSEADIAKLRRSRDEKEQQALRNVGEEIGVVTVKDEIFQNFCLLTDRINGRNEFVKDIERKAVEERFSIWLEMHDDEINRTDGSKLMQKLNQSFESFREDILKDDEEGRLIRNPYMFVTIGNKYLDEKKYTHAISEYTLAIEMDANFAEHARYNRGYAYIAEYGGDVTKNRPFIEKAIDDFETARKLIEEREYGLHLMHHASEGEVFSKQISNKLNLYNIQKNAIDVAIGPDINAIDRKIEEYRKLKERTETVSSDDWKKISEQIEKLQAEKENEGVIQKALADERDMRIEVTKMNKFLPENDRSHDKEIIEFERNGAIGSFQICEIPPIDWVSVIALLLLGLGQLVIGAAITIYTLGGGASFGVALIAEGISDIVAAVKNGIVNRDFDWTEWGVDKAISLVVSIVCVGFGAMKDVARTAYAGMKTAASIGNRVITETVKEGSKYVAKRIALELSKGVAKEIASTLTEYGVSRAIVPSIQQAIIEKVQVPVEKALKRNRSVKMMLELDRLNANRYYEDRILAMGMELLKPENSKDIFDLEDIAVKISTRIADKKVKKFPTLRKVYVALEAGLEIATLTKKFVDKLIRAIEEEATKDKVAQKLSDKSKTAKQRETTIQQPVEKLEGDVDLNRLPEQDEQAKLRKPSKDAKGMAKSFANVISTIMVDSIQKKMLSPVIRAGYDYTIDRLTSDMTETLSKQVDIYRSHRRIIHHQSRGFDNAETEEERNIAEVNQRIYRVEALIEETRYGGPSGLVHLGPASRALDRPIEVYDENEKLKYVVGKYEQGATLKIQYHEAREGQNIGHYTLPGNEEPLSNSENRNMCLYNVLAVQTGRDPDELKNSVLQIMENNKSHLAQQMDDINRLEIHSRLRLALGGATWNNKLSDDANLMRLNYHPLHCASIKSIADQKLHAISQQLRRKITVYDKSGQILYSKGEQFEGASIELEYNKRPGDTFGEWLTSKGGNEPPYAFHDPSDNHLYKIISKQANCDPSQLMSDVTSRLNRIPPEQSAAPLDNNSITVGDKETTFVSIADANYMKQHGLIVSRVEDAMNRFTASNLDQKLTIPVQDLRVWRTIYAQEWVKERPTGRIKPATNVVILLQHDPNVPVRIDLYPEL